MPKLKSHKGLLKRVKISARGKVLYKHAASGHLRSRKSGTKIQELRKMKRVSTGDLGRLEKMLHRKLNPGD